MVAFQRKNSVAARLTPTQVQDIREKYGTGHYTQGRLARDYGISVIQIGRIVRKEVWQHLPDLPPSDAQIRASAERFMEMQRETERAARDPFERLQEEAKQQRRGQDMLEELSNGTAGQPPIDPLSE